MADERVIIAVDADTSGAATELQDLRRSGERAAREIGDAFRASSKEIQRDFNKIQSGLEKVFGGVVGDVMDVSDALDELGLVAGTAAGAMLAGGGIVYALYQAADASGALTNEQARLSEAMADLGDAVGLYVAPAFEVAIEALASVTESVRFAVVGFEAMRQGVIVAARAVTNDMLGALDLVTVSLRGQYDAVRALATGGWGALEGQALANRQAMLAALAAHGQTPEVLAQSEQAIRDVWQQTQRLSETTHESTKATKDHNKAAKDAAKASEEWSQAVHVGPMRDLAAEAAAAEKAYHHLAAAVRASHDEIAATWASEAQALADARELRNATLGSWVDQTAKSAQAVAEALADSAAEGSRAQRNAALAAYAIQQGSAIAQAAVNAVLLGSELAVALAPSLGPAAIPAAAALATVQGATAAAAILAVPPPEVAHTGLAIGQPGPVAGSQGLAPDEVMVRARRGEEIVPRGRREAEPQVVVVSQYGHRLLDAVEGDRSRMRTSPYRQLVMRGTVPGHRRR